MSHDEVPMAFRARVENRCQIQRVIKDAIRQDSHRWVDDWKKVFPETILPSDEQPSPSKPLPSKPSQSNAAAWQRPSQPNKALARTAKPGSVSSQSDITSYIPQFGQGVQTKEYTLNWRLVSNSGQDEGDIRPIIGAKGFPYYSGASMKGAFLRMCTETEALRYCGGKQSDNETKPGILRFHGAYPADMNWTKRLVDIVHSQQKKQVIADETTNANAQISLYQTTLRFGISSNRQLEPSEWKRIWEIWECALADGIGSRVSAGYGQFKHVTPNQPILQVKLKGQGVASTLIGENQKKLAEFRPNMFKAALRGYTLRLLAGLTNETTAKELTENLWGGFGNGKGSVVGLLKVNFDFDANNLVMDVRNYKPNHNSASIPIYELKGGNLIISSMQHQLPEDKQQQLRTIADALIKFSMLLGGFGKSWRRVDHSLFYKKYLDNPSKPAIGCHWEFMDESISLYHPVNNLEDITTFLNSIRQVIRDWIPPEKLLTSGELNAEIKRWREPWHPQNVQVWGRIAETGKSQAIQWLHGAYNGSDSIKNPHRLAGSMGHTGCIWHRMYPRYKTNENGEIKPGKGYVELLTIFPPDNSPDTQRFLTFLREDTQFQKLW